LGTAANELRVHPFDRSRRESEISALYVTATGRRAVIVLAFVKKTRKTPDHVIKLALERARSIGP
jgi:phage-related protein